MITKRKTNLNYLLLGIAVALAAYLASEWEDAKRGFDDGLQGRPFNSEKLK